MLGAVLGGPITEYLIKRHKLCPGRRRNRRDPAKEQRRRREVTSRTLIEYAVRRARVPRGRQGAGAAGGGTGFILPDFVFRLLLGVVIRNATNFTPATLKLSDRTVEVVGDVALSLFLVMALMTMKLLDLANLAGPLLVILAAQAAVMIVFTVLVTYPVMGRNYDAAVISGGQWASACRRPLARSPS